MPWSAIMPCTPAGGIHTPSIFLHLPAARTEHATASIEAAEVGASIIRFHARDPETGKQDPRPETFNQFLPVAKQSADAAVNFSTVGGPGMSIDEHLPGATSASPETPFAATCLTTLRMTAWRSGSS